MNKLIKQLADQCMVEVKNVPCKGIDGWTTLETVRQIDPEKFAKLLVLESVANLKETKKAELPLLQAINENAREVPLSVYIVFLKEHFGVE